MHLPDIKGDRLISATSRQKTPTDSATGGKWYRFYFETKDTFVLYHHGLDAYFFLRFWKLAIMVCGLAWPLTWVILMPVYGTAHGGESQFDRISFSNIEVGIDSNRLYAVSIVAWLVFGQRPAHVDLPVVATLTCDQARPCS